MLGPSKKSDYALLALSYLAGTGERRVVCTKEIAERFAIPVELLAKVLQRLAKVGWLDSSPGPTGGYVLAVSDASITIGDVVRVVDGVPALTQCMQSRTHADCEQWANCTIRGPLATVNARVHDVLDGIALRDIAVSSPGRMGTDVQISAVPMGHRLPKRPNELPGDHTPSES